MKGYWLIVGTEISDQEAQAEYGRLWKPIGEKYQARTNTTKQPPLLVEARDAGRMILVEFPSLEIAKACYADPAYEEAKHFRMVRDRLRQLGADYGDLPAHDGLWQAAHSTRNDLTARLAVVPLILEARGLDVTPSLQAKMVETGDMESAAILDVIYNDEKGHVAVGAKWFRFLCARERKDPAAAFQQLVRANFRGSLKAPFNDIARAEAGLTPTFYRALTSTSS